MMASEMKPGNSVPVDTVPVKMRPENRKRLPISGAIIIAVSPMVTMSVVPMPGTLIGDGVGVRLGGLAGDWRRCGLGGLRNDRWTRNARRCLCFDRRRGRR